MDSTDDLKPPIATTAEENLRNASEISAVNLLLAQNELAIRMAGAATLSTKTLLDISEHAYKVSGMAKKQEVKAAGPGFSIMINLPGGQTALIGRDTADNQDIVGSLAGEARELLDWVDTPEF